MNILRKNPWAAWLLISLLPLPGLAQSPDAPAEEGEETPEQWVAPMGEEIVRIVEADVDEARNALLEVLEEDAITPDGELLDMDFVTSFATIEPGKFEGDVARPVPPFSLLRPILQPRVPRRANYRLWVRIAKIDEGTRVGLVAEMYQRLYSLTGLANVEQTSTGTIEKHYLDRLEQRLAEGAAP